MRTVWLLLPAFGAALPNDPDFIRWIQNGDHSNAECSAQECQKPERKFELISTTQPGIQWADAGGYCGSWSIQRSVMAKGAWISQKQVRDHSTAGGGNDHEILATNIDAALKSLKIKAEGFDYKNTPTPQLKAYQKWLKKQLVSGHTLAWMIMLQGGKYPIYPTLNMTNGVYSHVEPVVGFMSNHPLNDETVYDDDVLVHYTDADKYTYYRNMSSLPGEYITKPPIAVAVCPGTDYIGYPCINKDRGFAWAMQGFLDPTENVVPLSLTVDQWEHEPDLRRGEKPIALTGTLTITGLEKGSRYLIFRWGSVDEAFVYNNGYLSTDFIAANETFVYTDPATFSSDSATYYRCVKAGGDNGVVV